MQSTALLLASTTVLLCTKRLYSSPGSTSWSLALIFGSLLIVRCLRARTVQVDHRRQLDRLRRSGTCRTDVRRCNRAICGAQTGSEVLKLRLDAVPAGARHRDPRLIVGAAHLQAAGIWRVQNMSMHSIRDAAVRCVPVEVPRLQPASCGGVHVLCGRVSARQRSPHRAFARPAGAAAARRAADPPASPPPGAFPAPPP